ncbi:MAG: hypothetical protein LBJ87_06345 [bacterium]|nr:hypothetical protein [bacterium]
MARLPPDVATARRSHSSLWRVSAERWLRVAEPAGVRALGATSVPNVKRRWLLVLERC